MSSEPARPGRDAIVDRDIVATTDPVAPRRSSRTPVLILIAAVVAIDILAFLFAPGAPRSYPKEGIQGTFEYPAPRVVLNFTNHAPSTALITFEPTISSSIVMTWVVMVLVVIVGLIVGRGRRDVPGLGQNAVEAIYEGLEDFATSLGGTSARRYVPIFSAFFLFILFANWSGLFPVVGKIESLRAPTSDLNVTFGLALVSFFLFHIEGVRALGPRGYLGKFFSLRAFRDGIGAGFIALFVGLIEFLLEFAKPVTLSMRLFGNIYGGEVALTVITALVIAVVPVALVGLEFLLNFFQALIFSVLTLMFTLAAIEGHHDDHAEHDLASDMPEGNVAPEPGPQPQGAAA